MEVQISLLDPKVDYFGWDISWGPSVIPAKFWGNNIKEIKKFSFAFVHNINPLAPEFFFLILAHSVYKMWIIQEAKKLALWNKLHFVEKKTESIEHV